MTEFKEWDATTCPQCGEIAEIVWRDVLQSTDGPVEHAYVRCLHRHWFLMPSADLAAPSTFARSGGGSTLTKEGTV